MKLRMIALMAATLGTALPNAASADAGFSHVLPDLAVARPCGAEQTCSYTWTMTTRLGDMLNFAEQRYGPRDSAWTVLGVEFAEIDAPQVWYPKFGDGDRNIVIQITEDAARDQKKALFQLAHEVVHLLSPNGPDRRASVLEEGIATYNSLAYLRSAEFEIAPSYISAPSYEAAYWAIVELEAAQPDFASRIKALRAQGHGMSGLSAGELREAMPGVSEALAARLVAEF